MSNSFETILLNDKPIFYHYLDGLLDSAIGDHPENPRNFVLKNLISSPTFIKNEINFLSFDINYLSGICKLQFLSNKNKKLIVNNFDANNLPEIFTNLNMVEDSLHSSKTNAEKINTLLDKFKYCIYQISDDDHATSILFFQKNNKQYVLSFNSGQGIDNHGNTLINHNIFYSPFIGYRLVDNISEEPIECLTKIFTIMLIPELFTLFSKPYKLNDIITTTKKDKYILNFTLIDNIIKYLHKIKPFENKKIDFNLIVKVKESDREYNDLQILNSIRTGYSYPDSNNKLTGTKNFQEKQSKPGKKIYYIEGENPRTTNKIYFYSFFKTVLDLLELLPFIYSDIGLDDLSNYTPTNLNDFRISMDNIKDQIIKKIVLHQANNKLYILPQESGSCSWFSIYWPIIMAPIFISNDHNDYKKIINEINSIMLCKIKQTFSYDNFISVYNEYPDGIILMKNLCQKFINIGILENNVLKQQMDVLYDIEFTTSFNKKDLLNKDIEKVKSINSFMKTINQVNLDMGNPNLTFELSEFILSNFYIENENKEKYKFYNSMALLIYIVFKKCPELFSKMPSKIIPSTQINTYLSGLKYTKSARLPGKERILLYIKNDFQFKKLDNLILQFNSVVNHVNSNHENKPAYYCKYYLYAKYILEYFNSLDINTLKINNINRTEIDSSIINSFIEFMNNFNIMLQILNCFNNILKDELIQALHDSMQLVKNLGNFLYTNILKQISPYIIKTIDVLDYLENVDIEKHTLTIPDFDKFNNDLFINKTSNEISLKLSTFNLYEVNFTKYIQLIEELLNNPALENKGVNYEMNINFSQFIKLSIFDIFKNEQIRNNYLYYYCSQIWDDLTIKKNTNMDNFVNLQLLLSKSIGSFSQIIKQNNSNIFNYSLLTFNSNIYSIDEVILIIQKIIDQSKNKKEFCDEIIKKKDSLLDNEIKIKNLIIKHFPTTTFDGKLIKIKNDHGEIINYRLINIENNLFNNLLVIEPYSQILYSKSHNNILIINEQYFISLACSFKSDTFKINNINFNNSKVYKYKEIKFPFKYFLPANCLHFVYEEDNNLKVSYLVNPDLSIKDNIEKNILGKDLMNKQTITFEINDTRLIPKINNQNVLEVINLVKNYGINGFNIIISNFSQEPINTAFYLNKKIEDFLPKKLDTCKMKLRLKNFEEIKFINTSSLTENILNIEFIDKEKSRGLFSDELNSFNKLLHKISNCKINLTNLDLFICKLKKLETKSIEKVINLGNELGSKLNFIDWIDNHDLIYNIILNSKLYNAILNLTNILKTKDEFKLCSQVKIYSDIFNFRKNHFKYGFEVLFELLNGFIISEEQMNRYTDVVNKFIEHENKYNDTTYEMYDNNKINYTKEIKVIDVNYTNQIGGTKFNYPLHHFMMGKGKSTVITPLLALHFSLIYDKQVYIIVPIHLLEQTNNLIRPYIEVFELNHKIKILSDIEIKIEFLEGKFINNELNYVLLIDEFDTIIDPVKSNFNLTIKKDVKIIKIYNLLKHMVSIIKCKKTKYINKSDLMSDFGEFDSNTIQIIINDVNKIMSDLENGTLIENINWGISPDKCWAIPYLNKDKPMINSDFSSSILTIFLTLFHYIIDLDYKIDKFLYRYIINNSLVSKIFHINTDSQFFSMDDIEKLLDMYGRQEKINLILDEIFAKLLLSNEQYNTSFIDIINIEKMFKVGYSGTMNVLLPELKDDNFNSEKIIKDYDESTNVKYAIQKSNIINISKLNSTYLQSDDMVLRNFFDKVNILDYQAIIDTVGLFKNIDNKIIASKIYDKIKELKGIDTNVIYLDEMDRKYVYTLCNSHEYNPSKIYSNSFLYYSQTHIIGIDIKQDNLPIIKGLCIIDSKITYSIVAQSIFRLRKLNQGHTIDFLFIDNTDKITSNELYSYLLCNENKSQINKMDYLIYQTIKSEIRKERYKLKQNKLFQDNFKEKVKHYYMDTIIPYDQTELLFDGIITISEINKVNKLFSKINNQDSLYKLVYKINSLVVEQEQEQEKEKVKESNITETLNIVVEPFSINYGFDDNKIDWTTISTKLDKYAININKSISYLPNIYCNYDENNYYQNKTSFIYVYLPSNDKILVVPGYMIGYFIREYTVFNCKLEILNITKSFDITIIEKIKNYTIFDIHNTTSIKDHDIKKMDKELLLLLYYGSLSITNPTFMINKIRDYFIETYTKINLDPIQNKVIKRVVNDEFNKIIEQIRTKITKEMAKVSIQRINLDTIYYDYDIINIDLNDKYKKKYFLYKAKYLVLKNKLIK